MEAYKFQTKVDENKIFVVKRSEIIERIDASFYKEKFDFSNCISLSKLVDVKGGKRIPLGYDYSNSETNNLYLRVSNIPNTKDLNYSTLKFISDDVFQVLKRYEVYENDLIISIAGTIGKIKLLRKVPKGKKIILTENCAKLILKTSKISVEYLELILNTNFLKKQIKLNYIQTTIPKLGLDRILKLQIPTPPPLPIQQKIVTLYQKAYQIKQQKEQEAKSLLASIDTYLLNELGITLPKKETSLESRIFTIKFSEVSGDRFDTVFYKKEFQDVTKEINNSNFKVFKIKNIINSITNGFDFRDYKKSGTPYIKVANIKQGKFDFKKMQYININSHELSKKIQLRKGNILLTRKGTYGNALSLGRDLNYVISSEVFYIELKQEAVNSQYLEVFFNSVIGQKQFDRFSIGAIMGSLSQDAVNNLEIPLPPLAKQNELANHISSLRHRAKSLEAEGKEVLELAKQEVEKMILGE